MSIRNITFEIPEYVEEGIKLGKFVRTGGVIQWAPGTPQGGKIVTWLRETSPNPLSTDVLPACLGIVTPITSILNLGATVCFGVAILKKLGILEKKIDKLQWTVEMGFKSVLNYLKELIKYKEIEMIAEVKSAAELAWSAQFLEPDSNQRIARIEQALGQISLALEKILLHTEDNMNNTIEKFKTAVYFENWKKVCGSPQTLVSLERFRFACSAVSLKASIYAEANDLENSCNSLKKNIEKLENLLNSLGFAFLVDKKGGINHHFLLNKSFKKFLPVKRIETLASRFDKERKTIYDILEYCREYSCDIINKKNFLSPQSLKNFSKFLDLLDGAYEDLQRLKGYALEYKYMLDKNLKLQNYRELLKIEDAPENAKLAFIELKE